MVLLERYTLGKLAVVIVLSIFLIACSDSEGANEASERSLKQKSVPTSSVILACAKKVNGQLRVVADHSDCHPSEDPISWNQAGPAGPEGPQGPAGECSECKSLQYQFVGLSEQGDHGTTGVLKLTTYCQATYPGSRICTADEVVKSVTFPAVTSSIANSPPGGWVLPTAIDGRGASIGFDITSGHQTDTEGLTCGGWSGLATMATSSGGTGLTVNGRGQFRIRSCSSNFKVACCAPVKATQDQPAPVLSKPK